MIDLNCIFNRIDLNYIFNRIDIFNIDMSKSIKLGFFFILLVYILLFLVESPIQYLSFLFKRRLLFSISDIKSEFLTQNHVTILIWTDIFGKRFDKLIKNGNSCLFTSDRKFFNKSDAIIFHWFDINLHDLPLHDRPWIVYISESPAYTNLDSFPKIAQEFDMIMSYRFDSDFVAPYGSFVNRTKTISRPKVDFKNKTREVAWFASNCVTESQRENYVKELQKYINIDVYGFCGKIMGTGHYHCPKSKSVFCDKMLESKYKFYLSFENSVSKNFNYSKYYQHKLFQICKDYVTEKLFRILKYDVIPVRNE